SSILLHSIRYIHTATTELHTLSLHDALPIWRERRGGGDGGRERADRVPDAVPRRQGQAWRHDRRPRRQRRRRLGSRAARAARERSEEHTSELQSPDHLVCRLLLEKKKCCIMT